MEPPRRRLRTKSSPAALHLKWPLNTASLQVSSRTLLDVLLQHHPSVVEVLKYAGVLGLSHMECTTKSVRQVCCAHVLRELCEGVGAHVTLTSLHKVDWKKLWFVASYFKGESWTLSSVGAVFSIIRTGLEVIPAMPPDAWLLRVPPFDLTPYEVNKHVSQYDDVTLSRLSQAKLS